MRQKNKDGFTLIELLVVIGVIAILMAILVPALHKAREQAKQVVCMTNLKQWATLFRYYTDDNQGYYMPGIRGVGGRFSDDECWVHLLKPYYSDIQNPTQRNAPKLRICPTAKIPQTEGGTPPDTAWAIRERQYPPPLGRGESEGSWPHIWNDVGSYGINWWLGSYKGADGNYPSQYKWGKADQEWADNIPVLSDAGFMLARPHHTSIPGPKDGMFEWDPDNGMRRVCHNRHYGGVNMCMMDGSVRNIRPLKDLWELKWHREFDTSWGNANIDWSQYDWLTRAE